MTYLRTLKPMGGLVRCHVSHQLLARRCMVTMWMSASCFGIEYPRYRGNWFTKHKKQCGTQ